MDEVFLFSDGQQVSWRKVKFGPYRRIQCFYTNHPAPSRTTRQHHRVAFSPAPEAAVRSMANYIPDPATDWGPSDALHKTLINVWLCLLWAMVWKTSLITLNQGCLLRAPGQASSWIRLTRRMENGLELSEELCAWGIAGGTCFLFLLRAILVQE